jgi:hypothetical protein
VFQGLHLSGQRRLRNAQPFGGLAQTALRDDGEKRAKQIEVQGMRTVCVARMVASRSAQWRATPPRGKVSP